jgi:hypothetical protein
LLVWTPGSGKQQFLLPLTAIFLGKQLYTSGDTTHRVLWFPHATHTHIEPTAEPYLFFLLHPFATLFSSISLERAAHPSAPLPACPQLIAAPTSPPHTNTHPSLPPELHRQPLPVAPSLAYPPSIPAPMPLPHAHTNSIAAPKSLSLGLCPSLWEVLPWADSVAASR